MNIPPIKNALNNIKSACETRLNILYPAGVPEKIKKRYLYELQFLSNSKYLDDFEIFRLFSCEAKKSSTTFYMRGTVMGSIIHYLLGNDCFNPLETYYYCPDCGYYEEVQTHLYGIDLPQKKCPHCQKEIFADGFHLPLESVWGNNGDKLISFDYNVSTDFYPFAKRVLTGIYPDNTIVPCGMFQLDSQGATSIPMSNTIGVGLAGYVILPSGNSIDDYSDLVSYLEDGTPCLTGGSWNFEQHLLKSIRLFTSSWADHLVTLQRSTGVYINELSIPTLRETAWSNIANSTIPNWPTQSLFHEFKPKTFKEMVSLESAAHNTFASGKNSPDDIDLFAFKKFVSTDAFKQYPCYTREDFFKYLMEAGISRVLAFDISERIRKGHGASPAHKESFMVLTIPDELKEVASNYLYLFPEAHCIETILVYAKLAYYAKIDSKAFSKAVFKR